MIASGKDKWEEVLSRVADWPTRDRIILARKILETVETAHSDERRGYSAEEVIELLKMPQPAPGDTECQQILETEILRKHGL